MYRTAVSVSRHISLGISVGIIVGLTFVSAEPSEADDDRHETVYNRYLEISDLVTGGIVEPEWLADGSRFRFTEAGESGPITWEYDPQSQSRKPVPASSVKTVTPTQDADKPREVGRDVWGFPLLETLSPNEQWFLHRSENDLWLRRTGSEELRRLTNDGVDGYYWGEAFEWDGNYGRPWAWWSPDGSMIALRKVDERMVPTKSFVSYKDGEAKVESIAFAKPGDPLARRWIYLIDVDDRQQIRVDDDRDPEGHILALDWRRDGSEFFYISMDRLQKRLRLLAANARTGEARLLISEERDTFHDPLWSSPPQFTPLRDGAHFLWTSDRSGWRHIYLYNRDGVLLRQLTQDAFPVHEIIAVDEEREWIYFTGHTDQARPYDLHLARVGIDGDNYEQLTEANGIHRISMAPSLEYFVDTHSSVDRPHATELRRSDGQLVDILSTANIEKLEKIGWVPPEEVVVTSVDGKTQLHGVLYKPFNFDPARRYPVIEYIYDGSYTTVVNRTFPGTGSGDARNAFPLDRVDPLALAQLGFVVWVVDGRGTAERGKAFVDVVYGGQFDPIPDHVSALQQLATDRPFVDLGRVGVFGISAGGGQTLAALLKAPETYHVGVAIAPGVDLRNLRANGPEPRLGLPEDNPSAYEPELLALASSLRGRLMLMHGTDDPVVPVSHTLQMVDALIEAGKRHDLVLLPGQTHFIEGEAARYARNAVKRYFVEHLDP